MLMTARVQERELNTDVQTRHEPEVLDVVWGVAAIAKVVNRTERQAAYLLRTTTPYKGWLRGCADRRHGRRGLT